MIAIKPIFFRMFILITFIIVSVGTVPFVVLGESVNHSNIPSKYVDMTPFYWTIVIIGGCIGMTLIYVSWKKYKAERHDKHKNQNR